MKPLYRSPIRLIIATGAICLLSACEIITGDIGAHAAKAAGVVQIPAFLPERIEVQPGEAQAIDGVWRISSNRKRIRIDRGRAYALDPWVHAFTLKIQPGMVVAKNITSLGNGRYRAQDLPLLADTEYQLQSNGKLKVTAAYGAQKISFELTPVEIDDGQRLNEEMLSRGYSELEFPQALN